MGGGFWWGVWLIAVLSRFFLIWLIWLIASDLSRVGFGLFGWGLLVSDLCLFVSCEFPGFALWFVRVYRFGLGGLLVMLIVLVGGLCLPGKCMGWLSDCWFWLIALFLVSGGVGCLGSLWVWPRVGCSIFLILRLVMVQLM